VLAEGVVVGRIMRAAASPVDAPRRPHADARLRADALSGTSALRTPWRTLAAASDCSGWCSRKPSLDLVKSGLSVKANTHFAFRVDISDDTGASIVEHVAGVDDFEVAEATYRAAVARWPAARITLRQGIRVVRDTR